MAPDKLLTYLKQLSDIGGTVGGKVADVVGKSSRLASIGAGTAEEAAQAIQSLPLGKYISQAPVSVGTYQSLARNAPSIAGLAANVATQAAVPYVASQLVKGLTHSPEPFAEQQYYPGNLPLTNYQAGQAYLNQQRFQQQLALSQSEQMADRYNYQDRLALLRARQSQGSPYTPFKTNIDLSEDPFAAPVPVYE
jgi:hypothetical protein